MIVTRLKTGEWVHLNELKEIVATFESREEAVEALKKIHPKEKTQGCKHANIGPYEAALGPDRLNQGWLGNFCRDCGMFLTTAGAAPAIRREMGFEKDACILLGVPASSPDDHLRDDVRNKPQVPS